MSLNQHEVYFTEAPDANELLGYMAGGLRDCIDYCSDENDIKAMALWNEFGLASGFAKVRSDEDALDLAARMAACMDTIANCDETHSSVRLMALTNAEGHRQAVALIEAAS